jgi:hypothetical protein
LDNSILCIIFTVQNYYMEFIEFLTTERDKLNKVLDSIKLIAPEEIDCQDLYFYYAEFKQRQKLEVSEN